MTGICVDQRHKLAFKDLEIPPRRHPIQDMPSFDEELDPYSSDKFRMYEFKIRRCTRSRSHDWTDCPFAHPGEKARRRDPRRYRYSGTVCPEFRRGGCSRGDTCEFAHGVFECWLHPSRYRTEACKDGKSCKRKVCFFAHTPSQLRSPSDENNGSEISRCGTASAKGCTSVMSPTSTLFGLSRMSPPLSPPNSPPMSPPHHCSPFSDRLGLQFSSAALGYKKMVNDVMRSLEEMKFNDLRNNWNGTSVIDDRYGLFQGGTLKCGDEIWNDYGRFLNAEPDIKWVDDLLM